MSARPVTMEEDPGKSKDAERKEEEEQEIVDLDATCTILLCVFCDDMKRLFRAKLVDENKFMHALGALVVNSLRENYGRLEKASSEGTAGQDLNLEIARAGWSYDTSDFCYTKPAKSIREYGRTRKANLETYINKMIQTQALNAAVLSPESYSTVEKVILLKSCKIFETAGDAALQEVAALVKMIRVPANVQLYKEGEPGFDSFVVASGQVKLTKNKSLIGLRGSGAINGATCLVMAGDKRTATVTTTTEALIMCITYEDFDEVMQNEPELRKGMMRVLMDRLFDSYKRLNTIKKLQGRVTYFQNFRSELRLDVRNIRLRDPRRDESGAADFSTGFQEDDPDDGMIENPLN